MASTGSLDAFVIDLNGQLRGKRMPLSMAPKLLNEGFKLPRSALALDYWGDDVADNGLIFETGDNDGLCTPVTPVPQPIPWLNAQQGKACQWLCMMSNADSSPFDLDPRQLLKTVKERCQRVGFTPVVATELEFYLSDVHPNTLPSISTRQNTLEQPNAYSIDTLDEHRDLLQAIQQACHIQNIPIDTCISELGQGQFECNLNHIADPVLAADHAILFKRLVKGIAQQYGKQATFMAKPYGHRSGNGLHIHFSWLDDNGQNIFNDGSEQGSLLLQQALAGVLKAMSDSMLIFAPGLNAYRRLIVGSHAPVYANWGYDNRTTAVRIPESPGNARRIEHRVACADANPYLVIASILSAALHGIEQALTPPKATRGNGYQPESTSIACLPTDWHDALIRFQRSDLLPHLLNPQLIRVFAAVKQQEYSKFSQVISASEYETYF